MAVSFAPTTPPPAKKAATPSAAQRKTAAMAEQLRNDREEALNGIFQIGSALCIMANQWADAGAINMHAPNVSRETVALADRYENVGKALDALAQVGPFTAILGATLPLVLQIAANHKRVPSEKAGAMGVVPPSVLESRMRMEVARQEQAMRAEIRRQEEEAAAYEKQLQDEQAYWADLDKQADKAFA